MGHFRQNIFKCLIVINLGVVLKFSLIISHSGFDQRPITPSVVSVPNAELILQIPMIMSVQKLCDRRVSIKLRREAVQL